MSTVFKSLTVAAMVATTPAAAFASGVPVVDAAANAQLVAQLTKMIEDATTQANQLTQLVEQVNTLKSQLLSITGPRGISDIINATTDQFGRKAADSLQSIMDAARTGTSIPGNAGGMDSTINDLKTTFDLGDLGTLASSPVPQDRAVATTASAGMAAMAQAEESYKRSNAAMDRINQMVSDIDTNADLKASVDYNTRVLAEVAIMLNENLRMQAASGNAAGAEVLNMARERAAAKKFMKVGD